MSARFTAAVVEPASARRLSGGRAAAAAAAVVLAMVLVPGPAHGGVNGDGEADLLFTNLDGQPDRVCLADGAGGFTCSDLGTEFGHTASVRVADVDGDGDLDAILARGSGEPNRVCLGDGLGSFTCADLSGDGNRSDALALGDVNGDGDVDAVFANLGDGLAGERNKVCLGDGTGAFTCGDVGTDVHASADVRLGDVNGDGDLDAVFANLVNQRNRVCLGDGNGGFTCSDIGIDAHRSSSVAVGDVNGDGDLDAVFGNATLDRNRVCLGDGSGGFSCADVSTDTTFAAGVELGDVNGDGDLDAVFANISASGARNHVCLGDGTGQFTCGEVSTDANLSNNVALGDVDRDGNLDAVFANVGHRNRLCLGDGSGSFTCRDVSADTGHTHGVTLAPGKRGTFVDDDSSIFEADIEWLAAEGITRGCNPPVNDLFCPTAIVTRGQMAAFLSRALGLTDRLDDPFVDDDTSIFEADIERLAAAGITRGCNPPTNDRYCPDGLVTRGQMAAFLSRALGLTDDGGGNLFVDDDASIFEADIDKLGTAGITRGCNPPTNDRYCPDSFVTRQQMAAFLHRALG